MPANQVADLIHEMFIIILKLSAPTLIVGLTVGVVISLLQALTQVQEQTLTFVPKLFAIFICLVLSMSFMSDHLFSFTQSLFKHITQIE